jgi:hypothetical protein
MISVTMVRTLIFLLLKNLTFGESPKCFKSEENDTLRPPAPNPLPILPPPPPHPIPFPSSSPSPLTIQRIIWKEYWRESVSVQNTDRQKMASTLGTLRSDKLFILGTNGPWLYSKMLTPSHQTYHVLGYDDTSLIGLQVPQVSLERKKHNTPEDSFLKYRS